MPDMLYPLNDEDLIKKIISDTLNEKVDWVRDDDFDHIYMLVESNGVELKLIISDTDAIESFPIFGFDEFSSYYEQKILTLDIYMIKKNREIFCKRITSHQLLLTDLVNIIFKNNF